MKSQYTDPNEFIAALKRITDLRQLDRSDPNSSLLGFSAIEDGGETFVVDRDGQRVRRNDEGFYEVPAALNNSYGFQGEDGVGYFAGGGLDGSLADSPTAMRGVIPELMDKYGDQYRLDPERGWVLPANVQKEVGPATGATDDGFWGKDGPFRAFASTIGLAMGAAGLAGAAGLGAGAAAGAEGAAGLGAAELGSSGYSAFGGAPQFGSLNAAGLMDFAAAPGIASTTPGLSLGSLGTAGGLSLAPGAGLTTLGGEIGGGLSSGLPAFSNSETWPVNARPTVQGGDMDLSGFLDNYVNPFSNNIPASDTLAGLDFSSGGGLTGIADNPLLTGGMSGAGPLAFNPLGDGLFAATGGNSTPAWQRFLMDAGKKVFGQGASKLLGGAGGAGGAAGLGGAGGSGGDKGILDQLFGGESAGGIFGNGVNLAARIAPGMAALNFAKEQGNIDTGSLSGLLNQNVGGGGGGTGGGVDTSIFRDIAQSYGGFQNPFDTSKFNQIYNTSPSLGRAFDTSGLSQVFGNAQGLGRGFDTSNFSTLSGKVDSITDPYRSSVLGDYDRRTGQARGELLGNLERRGVMGSSFGNMDIGNFDTGNELQRGKLSGELGLQGIQAQRGLAQDIMGAQTSQRGFEQAGLGMQANIQNQLLQNQGQQRGLEQAGLGIQQTAANNMLGADAQQRQFGLNALQGLRGLGQDITGLQDKDRMFGLNVMNSKANIAGQMLNAQLQQKAIQSALYGRAFDVMGRAVSPSTSLFGGR